MTLPDVRIDEANLEHVVPRCQVIKSQRTRLSLLPIFHRILKRPYWVILPGGAARDGGAVGTAFVSRLYGTVLRIAAWAILEGRRAALSGGSRNRLSTRRMGGRRAV
jgi:hypothetical protein